MIAMKNNHNVPFQLIRIAVLALTIWSVRMDWHQGLQILLIVVCSLVWGALGYLEGLMDE